jgi:hypothetical protein
MKIASNARSKSKAETINSKEKQDIEILQLKKENYELQLKMKKYAPLRNEIAFKQSKIDELLKQRVHK